MFFADVVLHRRGPLAKVWLAAHYDKKLSKKEIVQASIRRSVDAIVNGENAPVLRVTGQLLVGVVRIYSRKAKYLLDECHEAKVAIQIAFRAGSTNVDLVFPSGSLNQQLSFARASTTLPDSFTEHDLLLFQTPVVLGLGQSKEAPHTPVVSMARRADITLDEGLMFSGTPHKHSRRSLLNEKASQEPTEDDKLDNAPLFDLDLGLDQDILFDTPSIPAVEPMEVEMGRDIAVQSPISFSVTHDLFNEATPSKSNMQEEMDFPALPSELDLLKDLETVTNELAPTSTPIKSVPDLPSGALDQPFLFTEEEERIEESEKENWNAKQRQRKSQSKKRRRVLDATIELNQSDLSHYVNDCTEITLATVPLVPRTYADLIRTNYLKMPFASRIQQPLLDGLCSELLLRCSTRSEESGVEDGTPQSKRARLDTPTSPTDRQHEVQEGQLREFDEDDHLFRSGPMDDSFAEFPEDLPPIEPAGDTEEAIQFSRPSLHVESNGVLPVALDHLVDDSEPALDKEPLEEEEELSVTGFSKSSLSIIQALSPYLKPDATPFKLLTWCAQSKRPEVTKRFYETLLLATRNVIRVAQAEPYQEITIQAQSKFFELIAE
jgi:cohesin complex subunit SCC1